MVFILPQQNGLFCHKVSTQLLICSFCVTNFQTLDKKVRNATERHSFVQSSLSLGYQAHQHFDVSQLIKELLHTIFRMSGLVES